MHSQTWKKIIFGASKYAQYIKYVLLGITEKKRKLLFRLAVKLWVQ